MKEPNMHASNSDFEIVPRQRTEGILAPKSPKTYTEPARVPPHVIRRRLQNVGKEVVQFAIRR